MKILSNNELAEISQQVNNYGNEVTQYIESIKTIIKNLNNEEIANVFYASGKFGDAQKEKLDKLRVALEKYQTRIVTDNNSLVNETQKYITKLTERNNSLGATSTGGASTGGGATPVAVEGIEAGTSEPHVAPEPTTTTGTVGTTTTGPVPTTNNPGTTAGRLPTAIIDNNPGNQITTPGFKPGTNVPVYKQ